MRARLNRPSGSAVSISSRLDAQAPYNAREVESMESGFSQKLADFRQPPRFDQLLEQSGAGLIGGGAGGKLLRERFDQPAWRLAVEAAIGGRLVAVSHLQEHRADDLLGEIGFP